MLFAAGTALDQSLFGFTAVLRVLLADGRSAGSGAQMVMPGIARLLFFPALAVQRGMNVPPNHWDE